jgi:hydrogenase maturation protease
MSGRILVAGIGNIFLGDDAFGVEVARRLDRSTLPDIVDVADYGIRGVHLAYELLDGRHDVLVLVDAIGLGAEPPGTLAVLDVSAAATPDPDELAEPAERIDAPAVDAHGMSPDAVLALLRGLQVRLRRVLVVGCQPAFVGEAMQLSPPVADAVAPATRLVVDVVMEEVGARA